MKPFSKAPRRYMPDKRLDSVVSLAIGLEMPLLVTGEPGTGKTRLSHYVLNEKMGRPGEDPLIFNTKTSSQSQDLFYHYDALRHFRDAGRDRDGKGEAGLRPIMNYVSFNALGRAILESANSRPVVLIDEIDKAPRDFPNDILYEFENMKFRVPEATPTETKAWVDTHYPGIEVDDQGFIQANQKPVLILTSNSEKNLPDAFLRRVLYQHIKFPEKDRLLEIIKANVTFENGVDETMIKEAVKYFEAIRDRRDIQKKPATAELLAWIHVLIQDEIDLEKAINTDDEALREKLYSSFSILAKNEDDKNRIEENFGK